MDHNFVLLHSCPHCHFKSPSPWDALRLDPQGLSLNIRKQASRRLLCQTAVDRRQHVKIQGAVCAVLVVRNEGGNEEGLPVRLRQMAPTPLVMILLRIIITINLHKRMEEDTPSSRQPPTPGGFISGRRIEICCWILRMCTRRWRPAWLGLPTNWVSRK